MKGNKYLTVSFPRTCRIKVRNHLFTEQNNIQFTVNPFPASGENRFHPNFITVFGETVDSENIKPKTTCFCLTQKTGRSWAETLLRKQKVVEHYFNKTTHFSAKVRWEIKVKSAIIILTENDFYYQKLLFFVTDKTIKNKWIHSGSFLKHATELKPI